MKLLYAILGVMLMILIVSPKMLKKNSKFRNLVHFIPKNGVKVMQISLKENITIPIASTNISRGIDFNILVKKDNVKKCQPLGVLIRYPISQNNITDCGLYFVFGRSIDDINVTLTNPSHHIHRSDPDGVFYFRIDGRAHTFSAMQRVYDVQADGQYIEILYDKDDNIPWKSNSKDLENQGYASSDCIVHDSHGTYNQNCADYTCKPYESIDSLKLAFQLEVSIIRGDPGCSQVVFEFDDDYRLDE